MNFSVASLEEVAFGQVRVVAPVEVLQVFALGQSR